MAYFHVLLNGSGTSGDGSTWDDDSSGTAAFIGTIGLDAAITAAGAGDIIYAKGAGSSATAFTPVTSKTLAFARNPVRVYGVIAATTNLGASVVTGDLVPGVAPGTSATRAYDQTAGNAPPSVTMTGASDMNFDADLYVYGVVFNTPDNLNFATNAGNNVSFEECHITMNGAGDRLQGNVLATTFMERCKITTAGGDYESASKASFFDCEWVASSVGNVAGPSSGIIDFDCCDFSGSSVAGFFEGGSVSTASAKLRNCQMPTSYTALVGADGFGVLVFENWGSDTTTGLTTGGSEQQYDRHNLRGDVALETTIVMTGGADDGSDGGFAYDMTTVAASTVLGQFGLGSPSMQFRVTGDGSAQTVTVNFVSAQGNTEAADWTDDEVWLEICYPSETGKSKYDTKSTRMALLDTTPNALTGTATDWGGTEGVDWKNPQSVSVSISPDYDGLARARLFFAPGANAETIFVDPEPVVT